MLALITEPPTGESTWVAGAGHLVTVIIGAGTRRPGKRIRGKFIDSRLPILIKN